MISKLFNLFLLLVCVVAIIRGWLAFYAYEYSEASAYFSLAILLYLMGKE